MPGYIADEGADGGSGASGIDSKGDTVVAAD